MKNDSDDIEKRAGMWKGRERNEERIEWEWEEDL